MGFLDCRGLDWKFHYIFLYIFFLIAVCLKDWHHINDKCYRYFSKPKTWLNAYYHCQAAYGAKLATVENKEENR